MKLTFLFFLLAGFQLALAQSKDDSLKYLIFTDAFGVEKKAAIVNANRILVVKGDSIFFIPDESELSRFINKNQKYNIIHNQDSVSAFLRKRIKALIVIKEKKKD